MMAKAKAKPTVTGRKRVGRAADKTPGKQPHAVGDNTPEEHRDAQKACIVAGYGTDEDIRGRCLEDVPGFGEMGERVQAELIRLMRKFWEMPVSPRLEVTQTESSVAIKPPEGTNVTLSALRTIETFASGSPEYTNRRVEQLTNAARARKDLGTESLMSDLAFVTGGGAQNTIQSTLLTQMAATHNAAMAALNMSMRTEYVDQLTQVGNLANRLLNTYSRQAETLARLQRDGTQTVKHIHIDNRHGGQAVVTDAIQTGGVNGKRERQSHATTTTGGGTEVLGYHPEGFGLPLSGCEGAEAVQDAWGDEPGGA